MDTCIRVWRFQRDRYQKLQKRSLLMRGLIGMTHSDNLFAWYWLTVISELWVNLGRIHNIFGSISKSVGILTCKGRKIVLEWLIINQTTQVLGPGNRIVNNSDPKSNLNIFRFLFDCPADRYLCYDENMWNHSTNNTYHILGLNENFRSAPILTEVMELLSPIDFSSSLCNPIPSWPSWYKFNKQELNFVFERFSTVCLRFTPSLVHVMLALLYLNKYTHSWNRRTKYSIIRNYLTGENTSVEL